MTEYSRQIDRWTQLEKALDREQRTTAIHMGHDLTRNYVDQQLIFPLF